jgi:hypothetical protein
MRSLDSLRNSSAAYRSIRKRARVRLTSSVMSR